MVFRYDPLALNKAKTAVIAYAVCIVIVADLFFVPLLFGHKIEWTYLHFAYALVIAFLACQLYRSVIVFRTIRRSECVVDPETVSASDNCNVLKGVKPFSVRRGAIRSAELIRKDVPPIGTMDAILLHCEDGDHVFFGIEHLDELLMELQSK
jgi:hypothetical protein